MHDFEQHPFLLFVQEHKSNPMVGQALQRLHHQLRLNQNIILYVLWYAQAEYGRLRKQQMISLDVATCHWHERITAALLRLQNLIEQLPFRKAMTLKQEMQREVALADQYECRYLIETLMQGGALKRSMHQQLNDACNNLIQYYKYKRIKLDSIDHQASIILLQSVFATIPAKSIADHFSRIFSSAHLEKVASPQMSLGDF